MALSEVVYCNDVVFVVTPYINVTSSPLRFAKSTENSFQCMLSELEYIIKSTRQISEKFVVHPASLFSGCRGDQELLRLAVSHLLRKK